MDMSLWHYAASNCSSRALRGKMSGGSRLCGECSKRLWNSPLYTHPYTAGHRCACPRAFFFTVLLEVERQC